MTKIYLAHSASHIKHLRAAAALGPSRLLVAYPLLGNFLKHRAALNVADWVMDSGAFSAFNSGKSIAVADYIAAAAGTDASEIYGLDVIGSVEGTRRNLDAMWSAGIDAIPTFHMGSDWGALTWCCRHSPAGKIALGGMAKRQGARKAWIQQVFARAWPQRMHAFGVSDLPVLESCPFDSADASSWAFAPNALGRFAGYNGVQIPLSPSRRHSLQIEIAEYQRRERVLASRWQHMLEPLRRSKNSKEST